MNGVNKVILIGTLGRDPEVRYTQGGQACTTFSLATGESWRDKQSGEKQERTEWHRIVAWAALGELCGQYLKKGRQAYVEGKIQTRKYQDKQGSERTITEIVASNVTFLGGGADKSSDNGGDYGYGATSSVSGEPQARVRAQSSIPPVVDDDDVPF